MRIPVWLRVSLFVAIVLIGVLVSTALLNVVGVGDDGVSGGRRQGSGAGMTTGDHDGADGSHGSGDRMGATDHGGADGNHGSCDRTSATDHGGADGGQGS